MGVFLFTLLLMLAVMIAMGIGRLLGRPGLRGGCGAAVGVDGGSQCAACSRPCAKRRQAEAARSESAIR